MNETPAGYRKLRPLSPLVALGAVMLAEGHFYGLFDLSFSRGGKPPFGELSWRLEGSGLDGLVGDFLSRYFLHLSAAALALFWVTVLGISLHVIRSSTEGARAWLRRLALLLPAAWTLWAVFEVVARGKNHVLIQVPRDLLTQFFEAHGKADVLFEENLLSAFFISTLGFLTAGMASVLLFGKEPADAGELRERFKRLHTLLYGGAVILVAGILHLNGLLRWAAGFLDEEESQALTTLADGYSTVNGIYWTLLLVALYLPSYWILRTEAWGLACRQSENAGHNQRVEWLADRDLAPSFREHLSHLGAVLAPFLAGGPVVGLLKLVGG